MLAALILAANAPHARTLSAPIVLRCHVNEDVEQHQFVLSINREKLTMTVSSRFFAPTTMPVLISPTAFKGSGPIHYNMTSFEITIPELKIRRTVVPHIWPGPTPNLVSEGRCFADTISR